MTETKPRTSEVAIFARLLEKAKGELSIELARFVLTIDFDENDQARMNALATKNQDGIASAEEREELRSYVTAGHLLALLHSKTRISLKHKKVS